MKKNKLFLLVISASFAFVSSCTKTEDNSTPTGDSRDVLVGNWTTSESSKLLPNTTFTISISKSTSDNVNIIIKNFYNLGSTTNTIAKVTGTQISISSQQVSGQKLEGSGVFANAKINWSYHTDDGGGNKDTCTALSSKQ